MCLLSSRLSHHDSRVSLHDSRVSLHDFMAGLRDSGVSSLFTDNLHYSRLNLNGSKGSPRYTTVSIDSRVDFSATVDMASMLPG